jgi:RecA/RadA recombinase
MAERKRRRSLLKQVEEHELDKNETVEDPGPDPSSITPERLIPSGSTMLNCACSGSPYGAFAFGSIVTIPGKSRSGKSVEALTIFTECAIDERFNDYDLMYDDVEQSLSFDLKKLFYPLVAEAPNSPIGCPKHRLKFPDIDDSEGEERPVSSETIQDFKGKILRMCESGKPFIYVLDSLDALTSTEELEREIKHAIALAKNPDDAKTLAGSYKAEKAKHIGEALRMINGYMKHTDSALFIIQQTRQRFNAPKFAAQWVTSGGEAPFFYSWHQLYMHKLSNVKATAKNIDFKIGGETQVDVLKNKLTGRVRSIKFNICEDYGIDDTTSCVDFLIKTKTWKSDSGGVTASDLFSTKVKRDELSNRIEQEGLQQQLQAIVGRVWSEIEDELKLDRAKRY